MEAVAHILGYFIVSPKSKAPEYLEPYAMKLFFAFLKTLSEEYNLV
jgi:hypothetical protein